ncbi:DNA ligase [Thiomicrorhabdus sp. Kp2]|uniref:DNA ligase n=1 Tax=Thiomicrorhabdus sp. Kp2 TaxID=1123518 RepID=UPI00041A27B8|nr:DNA ligase [Thiomicrorhabdus sp. Kp2]
MSSFTKFLKFKIDYKSLVRFPGFLVFGLVVFITGLLTVEVIKADDTVTKPNLMLLKTYHANEDVTGWLMSEKLDGVRAYWDGKHLISRQGNVFASPKWFTQNFPPFELDGELWLDRGQFEETVSIVRQQNPDNRWKQISYHIFEVPNQSGGLLERLQVLEMFLKDQPNTVIKIIKQTRIKANLDVEKELNRVLSLGGEGLVVRNPEIEYKTGRVTSALKVKQKQDAECIVRGYTKGLGKYTGLVGALKCELMTEQVNRLFPLLKSESRTVIKIGSGLSDAQRAQPPKMGSIVTFQYMGLTKKGLPRFPVFLRERAGEVIGE